MKKTIALLSIVIVALTSACTSNERARNYGGTEFINVDAGQKVMNVTWKGDDLWVLTENMKPTDTARVLTFREKSSYGVMEGKIVLSESKK